MYELCEYQALRNQTIKLQYHIEHLMQTYIYIKKIVLASNLDMLHKTERNILQPRKFHFYINALKPTVYLQ